MTGGLIASWDEPEDDDITGYQFRLRWSGGDWRPWRDMRASDAAAHSRRLPGLTSGVTYDLELRALNSEGKGPASTATATAGTQ